MSWITKPDFVTFIIPSLGRPTLKQSIQSLLNQPDWNWLCTIVFDGVEPPQITGLTPDIDYLEDDHFNVIKSKKLGHAGLVRNIGIETTETSFLAFLDDDDWIADTYMQSLKSYINKDPKLDLVIFTYKDMTTNNIQPPPKSTDIKECNVGISFAIRTSFVKEHNIRFTPYAVEDFRFLDDARKAGAKYLVTNDIQYFVSKRGGWR